MHSYSFDTPRLPLVATYTTSAYSSILHVCDTIRPTPWRPVAAFFSLQRFSFSFRTSPTLATNLHALLQPRAYDCPLYMPVCTLVDRSCPRVHQHASRPCSSITLPPLLHAPAPQTSSLCIATLITLPRAAPMHLHHVASPRPRLFSLQRDSSTSRSHALTPALDIKGHESQGQRVGTLVVKKGREKRHKRREKKKREKDWFSKEEPGLWVLCSFPFFWWIVLG